MKKLLTAIFCATALAGALSAAGELTRASVIERLDSCEAILQSIQGNYKTAIPADILRRAKGIVIVNQFQAGFIFGVKDGYAVALVRRPNGKWSVPAFMRAGELSLGLQAGGKSINAVYVLMDDATARLLFKNRMNLGAEAKVLAGQAAQERAHRACDIKQVGIGIGQHKGGRRQRQGQGPAKDAAAGELIHHHKPGGRGAQHGHSRCRQAAKQGRIGRIA